MPITREEAEKIIETKRQKLNEYLLNQDSVGVASLYHPRAVLLHDGEDQPIVGREAVQKAYERYLTVKVTFEDHLVYKSFTEDGKYLISHGEYEVPGQGAYTGKNHYEHVLQKQDNGDYLIYYQRRGTYKK